MFDQNMIIDATRGSAARFVNHSCEPNCRMVKWTVAGKPRMALFAGDNGIMTGEELTYDYNFDPFSQKNVQECKCGAPSCRGFLGPRSKEPKEAKPAKPVSKPVKEAKEMVAGVKRKLAAVLNPPAPARQPSVLRKKRQSNATALLRTASANSASTAGTGKENLLRDSSSPPSSGSGRAERASARARANTKGNGMAARAVAKIRNASRVKDGAVTKTTVRVVGTVSGLQMRQSTLTSWVR